MARVFISYATQDRGVAEEVAGWLRTAGHEPFLDYDFRDGISVGENWEQRLYHELRRADAVVGVVTSSFVASNWCSAEVGIARAEGCRLIPLCAEAGVVHPLMPCLQYADYEADPEQARDRVLQTVRSLDGSGTWREGDNPYPGLEPFTAALSQVFFGRTAEARAVSNQLRAMYSTGSAGGVLAVVGPSGCGKSSLLNAAIAPLLDSDPAWLRVPTLVPSTDPLPELARSLAATAAPLGLSWSASDVRSRLEAGTDGLRWVADDLLAAGPGMHQRQRLLVMVDQAEELFTRTTRAARRQFTQLLSVAMKGPVQVAVVMRSEFLDDLRKIPALAGRPIEVYVLAPLGREMLRAVIEQPARVARLRLDEGLATALVADTGRGEALPLLAFIVRQLAEDLPPGGTLSLSRYRDLGGVQGALTRHADTALAEAVRASGLTKAKVLAGLTRLVTVDGTDRRARRRSQLPDPADPLHPALQVFVNRRLLLSDIDSEGHAWLIVAHEALLTEWQPLDTAISNVTDALRAARAVQQAAAEWIKAKRPEHYLWDGKRLTATRVALGMADEGSNHNPAAPLVALDDEARAFLDATDQHVSAVKKRRQRLRTTIFAALTTLLLLVTTASIVALYQRNTARTQRDTAILNQLITQADRLRNTDISLAAQLDFTGYRMRPTPDFYTALIATENAVLSTLLTGHTFAVTSVVFSPDGRTLASGSNDHTVRLWNMGDPAHPTPLDQPLTGHTGYVNQVVFSPDGRFLASGSTDNTVRLWNMTDPIHPTPLGQPLTGYNGSVNRVVFSPDGRTLASGGGDGTVQLWNMGDPAHPTPLGQPLTSHTGPVSKMVFSPDGRLLASGSTDNTLQLWNMTDPAHPTSLGQPLTGHNGPITKMVFSPDGRTLASGNDDGTVQLWNMGDPAHPTLLGQPLTGHTSSVLSVVFSPDGRTLASGGGDGTVRLWNMGDPAHPTPLGQPLTGHTGSVLSVVFSPDGRTLVSGSNDHTVRLWNIPDALLTGHTAFVTSVVFSPDGHTLASGSGDKTVRLWNMGDPAHFTPLGQPLTGHTGPVNKMVFSPNGHTLASGGGDGTVRLWNMGDPAHPTSLGQPLTSHTGSVLSVVFSPDGRTLASGGDDGMVRLWNMADSAHPTPLGQPLTDYTSSVFSVVFSPDGRTLASGGDDGMVRLWNMADSAHPTPLGQPLTGHTGFVFSVVFSPDGRTLASGSGDGMVRLWNMADSAHPTPLGQPLTGHTSSVTSVVFSPDGHTLASSSGDKTVRLWNMTDPTHPTPLGQPLTGHTSSVNQVVFSPDGHTLASGSSDNTVRLWEMTVGRAIQRICALTTNAFTPAKWSQYVSPDLPYRPPCL